MPYVRTVKTKSGATAVQVVWSSQRGSRSIEHIGSAHDEAELEALKAAARQKIAAGQLELDLGLQAAGPSGPLPVTSSRMGHLLDALDRGYRVLGLDDGGRQGRGVPAAGGGKGHRAGEQARLAAGAGGGRETAAPSYATVKRRLPAYAKEEWRQRLSEACAAHARLGPASLVLYDVSTLYFETDQGDGFREPGYLEGAAAGAADHHRAAHRPGRVPADAVGVRGRQGRDQDHAPGHQGVHGRPPAARRHRGRRRGHDLRRQHEGHRGRGPVVHLGHEGPRRPLPHRPVAAGAPRARRSPTGTCSPSRGPPGRRTTAATRSSTTSTAPTGPGGRCTASTSRSRRRRRPSTGSRRSSATGSSSSTERSRASTANWSRRPAPWPGSRATRPTWPPPRTASRSPRTS